jgi:NADP-dependent 3-hydroxy acid dehydrogenase YdfG
MKDSVAIVTGASQSIGRSTAIRLARRCIRCPKCSLTKTFFRHSNEELGEICTLRH